MYETSEYSNSKVYHNLLTEVSNHTNTNYATNMLHVTFTLKS